MLKIEAIARSFARLVAIGAVVALSGCVTPYIDASVKDLRAEDRVAIAHPQPVQLLFEFQTKGVANADATKFVKDEVWNTTQSSGLFSQVSADPVPSGALLHVTINNVALTDNAFAKGFVTGFTFGLVGTTVGDGYVVTLDYLPGGSSQHIEKTVHDAIYTSLGATAPTPDHAEKMPSLKDAVLTMTRRTVSNGLNDLAKDPVFVQTRVSALGR